MISHNQQGATPASGSLAQIWTSGAISALTWINKEEEEERARKNTIRNMHTKKVVI
ncbi:hypothetical protein ABVT39_009118 [Epinephelus coioides]